MTAAGDTDNDQLKAVAEAAGAEILVAMATATTAATVRDGDSGDDDDNKDSVHNAMAGATGNNQLLKRGRCRWEDRGVLTWNLASVAASPQLLSQRSQRQLLAVLIPTWKSTSKTRNYVI